MTTTPVRLPEHLIHPFAPAGRANPHPAYRWLRANDPVHYDAASRLWLVTAHADCATVLRDPRFSAAQGQRERARDDALPPSMLTTDPPDHHRLRAPGALLLGPAAVRPLGVHLAADVDALLDRLPTDRPVDAVADLGRPLATAVYARLFGLPAEQLQRFEALARAASVNLDPMVPPARAALGRSAAGALTHYLDGHTTRALLEGLRVPLTALAADDRLSRAEMLGVLNLAVIGGWQPLAESIGNALHLLLPDRPAVARLAQADEDAARLAVDELLRLEAPIPFTARVTTERVELRGGELPPGARVLAVLTAANRDPDVFTDPDALRLDRNPNPHLGFGGGPHFCLAAPLVRQTAALLLPRLVGRFPALRGPAGAPDWDQCLVPRRLRALPIDLGGEL
ncbi:cytochrome P450 [Streptomyces sp. NRRL S-350]|uniref:cytochrome P450 n=1 Tax=Streptomyces sp. NRRL S-350 TaxID=1463902 RepID=UPI0006920DFD|nr:cytochrome P450 [Streptomyces sp. NRRL S-350]